MPIIARSTGGVSDIIGRKVPGTICALIQVGALVWLIWSRDLWALYLFATVFGITWGGLSNMVTALIGDTFGTRSLGVIMGVIGIWWGLGAAIGPAIGGGIFDASGSYFTVFVTGAAFMLIATLLAALLRKETGTESSQKEQKSLRHLR